MQKEKTTKAKPKNLGGESLASAPNLLFVCSPGVLLF